MGKGWLLDGEESLQKFLASRSCFARLYIPIGFFFFKFHGEKLFYWGWVLCLYSGLLYCFIWGLVFVCFVFSLVKSKMFT